jgi:hypothetical protein
VTTRMVFEALVIKSDLPKVELRLGKRYKQAPNVISRALNRAAEATKTKAIKETTGKYFLKASDIRPKISTYKSSKTRLRATVIVKDNKMPLEKFKVSPSKPRPKNPPILKVGVKRPELKEFSGAFVIPNLKVYKRVGPKRYPIKRIYGPAVPQIISGQKMRYEIQSESYKTYQRRLDHEIKRILEGN